MVMIHNEIDASCTVKRCFKISKTSLGKQPLPRVRSIFPPMMEVEILKHGNEDTRGSEDKAHKCTF